jgi:AcrR family transcriptional regulator
MRSPTPNKRGRAGDPVATRKRILDAAEARLLKLGPNGLVLEAVAADAKVSKGGLLYHFGSKESLVDGLIERMLDEFDRSQDTAVALDRKAMGRWTRAYLATTVTDGGLPADNSAQLMAGILAAIDNDPVRLGIIRKRFAVWHLRLLHDGIDPVQATIVRLAADGLWLAALLGLPGLDTRLHHRVLTRIKRMIRSR